MKKCRYPRGGYSFEGSRFRRRVFAGLGLLSLISVPILACQKPPEERAIDLMNEGRFQQASDVLRPEIEKRPADSALNELYGTVLLRNSQPSLAVWPLRRAYRENEDHSVSGPLLVEALITGGAPREGLELVHELIDEQPDDVYLLQLRSRAFAGVLDREGALADLERLIELRPDSPRFLEQRVTLLIDLDRLDEAERGIADLRLYLEEEEEALPAGAMARFCGAEARFQYKHGELAQSEALFEKCLAKYPANADLLLPLMEMLHATGQAKRAGEIIEEHASAELGLSRLRLQIMWAMDLESRGEDEAAEEVLLQAAERLDAPQPWLELADHHLRMDNMQGVADALDRAVAQQIGEGADAAVFDYGLIPQEGLFAYGDILIQTGEFERVRKIMKSLEEPVYVLLLEARMKLSQGDPRGALDDYEEAFRSWSSNAGARYLAAEAALRIGEFDIAMNHYTDSLRADADASDAGLILARLHMYQGLPRASFDTLIYYLRNIESQDNALSILHMMSQAVLEMGGSTEAAEYVRKDTMQLSDPAAPGLAVADYATFLMNMEGPEAALQYLDSVESLDSQDFAVPLLLWSNLTNKMGESEAARARIEAALVLHPDSAELKVSLASFYAGLPGMREQAGALLEEAVEQAPDLLRARLSRVAFLGEGDDVDALVAELDVATGLDSKDPSFGYEAAMALLGAERNEEALARLQRHWDRFPWYGDTATQLARSRLERNDVGADSLVLARIGTEFGFRERRLAWEILGRVRLARDELAEAEKALLEAIRLVPDRPTSHYYLGLALLEGGRNGPARVAFERALALGDWPGAEEARAELAKLGPLPEPVGVEESRQ